MKVIDRTIEAPRAAASQTIKVSALHAFAYCQRLFYPCKVVYKSFWNNGYRDRYVYTCDAVRR